MRNKCKIINVQRNDKAFMVYLLHGARYDVYNHHVCMVSVVCDVCVYAGWRCMRVCELECGCDLTSYCDINKLLGNINCICFLTNFIFAIFHYYVHISFRFSTFIYKNLVVYVNNNDFIDDLC